MKLTLGLKNLKPFNEGGITKIRRKEIVVIDEDTGELLDERVGLVWGDKSLVVHDMLLTEDHVKGDPEDASYLVLVIRCDNAIEVN